MPDIVEDDRDEGVKAIIKADEDERKARILDAIMSKEVLRHRGDGYLLRYLIDTSLSPLLETMSAELQALYPDWNGDR